MVATADWVFAQHKSFSYGDQSVYTESVETDGMETDDMEMDSLVESLMNLKIKDAVIETDDIEMDDPEMDSLVESLASLKIKDLEGSVTGYGGFFSVAFDETANQRGPKSAIPALVQQDILRNKVS